MDGVVLGILRADGFVDIKRTRALVEQATPLPVTFHRAFDEVDDFGEALEAVIATGARRILTAGGAARAVDGVAVLEHLVKQAGQRIGIVPGAGIDAGNVVRIVQVTKACEVHASLGLAGLPAGDGRVAEWEQKVRGMRTALDGTRNLA